MFMVFLQIWNLSLKLREKKFRIGNLEFVQLKTVLLPSIQLSLKLILLVKYESLDYRQPEVPNKWYQVPTVRVFLINVANFWTVYKGVDSA